MANELMMNMTHMPDKRGIRTMDEYYGLVQGRLAEERAYAARARLAHLVQRAPEAGGVSGPTRLLSALRERIGHALVSLGSVVEGRGASHPHLPAGRAR